MKSQQEHNFEEKRVPKKMTPDKESDYGPLDHIDHFVLVGATASNPRKRKRDSAHPCNTLNAINVDNSVVQHFPKCWKKSKDEEKLE